MFLFQLSSQKILAEPEFLGNGVKKMQGGLQFEI